MSYYTKFKTDTGLECGYLIDGMKAPYSELAQIPKEEVWGLFANRIRIKLFSKMPRSYYYSALNEAGDWFDTHIWPTLISPTK